MKLSWGAKQRTRGLGENKSTKEVNKERVREWEIERALPITYTMHILCIDTVDKRGASSVWVTTLRGHSESLLIGFIGFLFFLKEEWYIRCPSSPHKGFPLHWGSQYILYPQPAEDRLFYLLQSRNKPFEGSLRVKCKANTTSIAWAIFNCPRWVEQGDN